MQNISIYYVYLSDKERKRSKKKTASQDFLLDEFCGD